MSNIRYKLVNAAIHKAFALIDSNINNDSDEHYEIMQQTILDDESITNDEKSEAIRLLNKTHNKHKILYNIGKKRICENCQLKCLAISYCEYCMRNYLKSNFSNWTSGNYDIDDLIQKCQMESLSPYSIVEWIPYNNLQNVKYLTKVLDNVESANRSWFDEAKSHLTIANKWGFIVQCYGLTQDPSNGNYMLVMKQLDTNLRKYLQQNHNQLTWKEKIKIAFGIIIALIKVHNEKAIHRDLHSGNILYLEVSNSWYIGDLGFCGPADKLLGSIYGNLPYIAPEVIVGNGYTFASDIYSIAMLMWEISSGQPPFANYGHDYYLAMNIVNGMRPKIVSGTPLKYKELMQRCWDADPANRPDIETLWEEIAEINKNSNVYNFKHLPEPRNATQTYHSIQNELSIPHGTVDIVEQDNLQIPVDMYNNQKLNFGFVENEKEDLIAKSKKMRFNNDEDKSEAYNNPNLHSEDQNELEIPEVIISDVFDSQIRVISHLSNKCKNIWEIKDFVAAIKSVIKIFKIRFLTKKLFSQESFELYLLY
ncbi:kinase-like domain-containing protein [Glomus cerebriforme]|uniref:Kinase-like domain-containing protein n=1 Tax=Glomus cerebriforme TaxID=658196 RepID=A0A397S845_9GLOM|nr:kinase-like domain-containing protein [Glomus cerebriforme]